MSYYILYPLAYLFGLLPYKVQFLFADLLRWLLYGVVRYRRRVVHQNLVESFPEKGSREIKEIERKFYKHLADVFIETLSMASVSERKIRKRMRYLNVHQVDEWAEGRSWVCAMAHYGSWEYTVNFALYGQQDDVLGVYRPLHNKGIDRFYKKVRSRFGTIPMPKDELGKEMVRRVRANSPVAVALIADQTPKFRDIQNWTLFLGRWTPFYTGMEKLARRFHIPVAFLNMDKVGRGYYEGIFELIYDGREEVEEGEITRRYAERLEEMIRRRPELWMWSHRRWKFNREEWLCRHEK